ncbi:MAG: conserved phage C-terminal domain-containing protein [Lachnospiraceae bacterium]|nr:conserved phage C-terminal domain-containing protein [Lachnospiraceae bacterium]
MEKTKDYTTMGNYHFREKNMSFKAKGMLSTMLSLPDDWDYTMEGLAALGSDGIDSVRSTLKELERFGYVEVMRTRDELGRLRGTEYVIHEKPVPKDPVLENPILEEPILENPILEEPILENPTLEKPILENPRQLNTNILNTKELNTKESSTKGINNILSGKPDDASDSVPENVPVKPGKPKKPKTKTHPEEVKQIVEYFNHVCGTNYKYQSEATASMINARLNDGFTVQDFYRVIDTKYAEWANDGDMCKYLRPQTLFRPSHFESYLNQRSAPAAESANRISKEMSELYNALIIE